MSAFPSTKELLGDLVALAPCTLQGQRDIAEYIQDLAERWSLGIARIVDFPEDAYLSGGSPKPCNILIQKGDGTDECIVCHSHFDVVPPEDYPANFHRKPHELTEDPHNPDICYGDGAYDMLGSLASDLQAFHTMEPWTGRTMVLASVSGEEAQSQGTHALFHRDFLPNENPIRRADGFISGEIPVGASITDPQTILIGRPGRVGLQLDVHGEAFHSGKLRRELFEKLTATREALVKLSLKDLCFPEHPDDPQKLMPESLCAPGVWKSNKPRSLTVVSHGLLTLDILFSNPALSPTEIQSIVYRHIEGILGDEDFTLTFEQNRETPFTKPYLERVDHPFVKRGLEIAAEVNGECRPPRAGRGTADEPILVHEAQKPCIIYPLCGENEHTREEQVSIKSIENRVAFMVNAAESPRPLTRFD